MNPRYPVYIISKGRWESRLTAKALEKMQVPYRIVIEPQEYTNYSSVIDPKKILTLPFSNLGLGSIPARNWVWDHSINEGYDRHWILDDNISGFYRVTKNIKWNVTSGVGFRVIEDFADRYENLAQTGMQYEMFHPRKRKNPPLIFNTRIYSCILNYNKLPFRWRGRYNEDTDLSLRCLKAGWCTVLNCVFLANKMPTLTMKGGNTDQLYKHTDGFDGRLEMAKSLQRQHPDVTTIKRKWGRWQHEVNYKPFKNNKLILKQNVKIEKGSNDYGMTLTYKGIPYGG